MKILEALALGLVFIYFGIALLGASNLDNSDNPNGTRSGMTPKTDYKTGCQYLQSPFGFAITPRLDKDGKPICGASK